MLAVGAGFLGFGAGLIMVDLSPDGTITGRMLGDLFLALLGLGPSVSTGPFD